MQGGRLSVADAQRLTGQGRPWAGFLPSLSPRRVRGVQSVSGGRGIVFYLLFAALEALGVRTWCCLEALWLGPTFLGPMDRCSLEPSKAPPRESASVRMALLVPQKAALRGCRCSVHSRGQDTSRAGSLTSSVLWPATASRPPLALEALSATLIELSSWARCARYSPHTACITSTESPQSAGRSEHYSPIFFFQMRKLQLKKDR